MFYVRLQQQLCGKHDVWHNFRDENYFKNKQTVTSSLSLSQQNILTTPPNSLQKACNYNWQVLDEIEYTSWINSCTEDLQDIALS